MTPKAQSLFSATVSDRVALARRRYFDEGELPSGMVSDAVFQSWARCQRLHDDPHRKVTFQPVTASRSHLALQKNHLLHRAWEQELSNLQAVLGRSSCAAMLTDATGVLIGATCVGRPHEHLMPVATRIGVNLSEEAVGTTAPGVVARTGQAVCVVGGEHFFDSIKTMHCAAAPIRDAGGHLVGVLDISSELVPFQFDSAAVVAVYANAIENRLLLSQSSEHLVVRFQVTPYLLDSSMVALVGVASDGRLAWRNLMASRLLGLPPPERALNTMAVEDVMGASLSELASLPRVGGAALRLPSGLVVWARSDMRARDGFVSAIPVGPVGRESVQAGTQIILARDNPPLDVAAGDRPSLRDSEQDLIVRTLDELQGNVAQTARKLGVSRGLIYRRLRAARHGKPASE
jgi:transcriptional regulator of acetoin/glycerol metabolism